MNTSANLRALVAQMAEQVVEQGQSLSTLMPASQQRIADKDKGLLQELCFGLLRTLPQLDWFANQLMARPLTGKQRCLHYLILLGFYQLLYTRIPPHAVLAETVNAAHPLKRSAFKGLVNGVLRQFQRQQAQLQAASLQQPCQHLFPQWLLNRLQHAYPRHWQQIVHASNQHPPMWLRINHRLISREDWLLRLQEAGGQAYPHPHSPHALRLETPAPVHSLPGFARGWFSVQDAGAQRAVELLAPGDEEDILDLCAAPGGKTTHILQLANKARVLAVDADSQRLARIQDNLRRMQLQAELQAADGRYPEQWAHQRHFDRILLDAPCSATGVIRRHPDIKWLRRDEDIAPLAALQGELLRAAWSRLKTGGCLVYATCSLLPEENQQQIDAFLASTASARLAAPVEQLLPGNEHTDGFFYAKLHKV